MKIITIVGPTASGKTDISLRIAKRIGGEIINADSMLFYKDLSIGTDKPKKDKYKKYYYVNGIRHYLIDFLSPKKNYSLGSFIKEVKKNIEYISSKGKVPIIVGGSALYTNAIIYNYNLSEISPNSRLRSSLYSKNIEYLLKILKQKSIVSYRIVDKKNKRRIIRAIELADKGKSVSREKKNISNNMLLLGIKKEKEDINKNINKRIDLMTKNGLILEIKRLLKKYPKKSPAFLAIGYKEIIPYLDGLASFEEAIDKVKINTRKLAKKQMTWYRRDKNIKWVQSYREAQKIVVKFLN